MKVLREADWSDFEAEFLVAVSNVVSCNVEDGHVIEFVGVELEDCLVPLAILNLQRIDGFTNN